MNDSTAYLFDPTPYTKSRPRTRIRRKRRDPRVAAALARVAAALDDLSPEEVQRRQARAEALGLGWRRR